MPYDPIDDAPALRAALKELNARERLSAQAVLNMFNEAKPPKSGFSLGLATFMRFIGSKDIPGKDITRNRELRFIWNLLEGHPDYGKYMKKGAKTSETQDFGVALAAFFSNSHTAEQLNEARKHLPGEYVMMRRDMDIYSRMPDGVRVSRMLISKTLQVQEIQNYQQDGDKEGYRQHDTGYMFAYGRYLRFLMKEVGGSGVKYGIIKYDSHSGSVVQWFEGAYYVASNRATFPRARFFCRRIASGKDAPPSGYIRLGEITDLDARGYLSKDFKTESKKRV